MSDATDRKLPVWRSALYVPANVPRFIDGAHKRGADAIIVDLEDSVPIAERPAARRDLPATAESVSRGGADIIVRINRPWRQRSEEHTSELQSPMYLVCRLLLEKKKLITRHAILF